MVGRGHLLYAEHSLPCLSWVVWLSNWLDVELCLDVPFYLVVPLWLRLLLLAIWFLSVDIEDWTIIPCYFLCVHFLSWKCRKGCLVSVWFKAGQLARGMLYSILDGMSATLLRVFLIFRSSPRIVGDITSVPSPLSTAFPESAKLECCIGRKAFHLF